MQIKEIKISEIKLYEKNNKIHNKEQIELLKKTITEFWFTNPVLLSDKNECIWWHWRIQAMQELWKEIIPAVYIKDLTPEQVRKLRLLDNKIAELAEDNIEAIKFELEELEDQELNELYNLDIEIDPDKEAIEDDVPDVPTNIIVEKWDIFQLWEHRLMCWDSTNIDDVEKLMDWEKADFMYTDPPYWINYSSENSWYNTSNKFEVIKNDETLIDFTNIFLIDCKKVIWWANCFPEKLPHRWRWCVWYKRWDGAEKALWSPYELAWIDMDSWYDRFYKVVHWWFVNSDWWKRLHPTQKPTKLCELILDDLWKDTKNILDLFWWSWSTLIASEKTNRKCYMMELDEKYIQVILKRYKDYTDWKKEIKCINREIENFNSIFE